jgi:DNA topoisomerase-3
MKSLVIAEKPSVAQDIAKVLGAKRDGDHYENDQYVIAAAAGHLVELYMPEDIDKKRYGFWRLQELPIVPEKFELKPISDKRNRDRLEALKKLIKRKDVELILNACDAGREGELIFTYIVELAKSKKPIKRVWMQSMTKEAIKDAFENLRSEEQMQGLQDAARSRSEADWLIGINGTRAITKRMFGRSKSVATVGRVQTPTLSIVLRRELEIRNFKPQTFWRIHGEFGIEAGEYEGIYTKDATQKDENEADRADRLWEEDEAKAVLAAAQGADVATVSDEKKRTRQSSGRLYDLTSLQREANGRFGFSATRTLQIAQSLYEKHKVLTYPRTDSRALPEDYIGTVKSTLGSLPGELGEKARPVLANDWVRPNKRIFNNAQISDHFAIIPTGQTPSKLSPDEEKIFDMVARRFIAIFYPPAEFDETTRLSIVAEHTFKTVGKVLVKAGYLDVYGKAQLDRELPPLGEGDRSPSWLPTGAPSSEFYAKPLNTTLEEDQTKPPSRYTEATLLSAMEGAGKLVDDDELADAMKEKGLGTPATRASTIEHLLKEKYFEREGRYLLPTTKAENLFEFLNAVKADVLTHPDLTGEWEYKLRQMEQKKLSRNEFMQGITDLTKQIVDRTKNFEEDDTATRDTSIISPTDSLPMKETLRTFKSQDGEITIYKTVAGRKLEEAEVAQLVKERMVGPLDDFRSKAGKPFSAILRLDAMNKVKFDFGNSDEEGENGEPLDVSQLKVIGTFPGTGAKVYETPTAYQCENSINGDKAKGFRMSRTMLGKALQPEEVATLLETGKTPLIKGFKSKRTGRLFDAFLLLKSGGKIGFEFPPRPAKKAGATKKTAAKKAAKSSE